MLIGLHGKKRSGKDEVFKRMVALGFSPVRVGFADDMKVSLMASFGFRYDEMGGRRSDEELIALADVFKDHGTVSVDIGNGVRKTITGRQSAQYTGTEGGREVHGDDVWVSLGMAKVDTANPLTVFTDVRFPNEAECILGAGGVIIRIDGKMSDGDSHGSETPLPDNLVSYVIDNTNHDDDFASLDAQIQSIMRELTA